MSCYKRFYQPGAYYFFTLVTYKRLPIFSDQENVKLFKSALKKVKNEYQFSLNAIVILPDHIHCIWKMPEQDVNYSLRWRLIKRYFSMQIESPVNKRHEKEIWQRRFWMHLIQDEEDLENHMHYIHYNPVKHKYVLSPKEWQHSSFHYWVQKGVYQQEWGSCVEIDFNAIKNME